MLTVDGLDSIPLHTKILARTRTVVVEFCVPTSLESESSEPRQPSFGLDEIVDK
jgi:hypothetical protein